MSENRNKSTNKALQSATAMDCRLGEHSVGSPQSRAAARALVDARKVSSDRNAAEVDWDQEPQIPEHLAESLANARGCRHEPLVSDFTPIPIPSGKENTVLGRYRARINAARARAAARKAEREKRTP
jgi:hypothetical protein